MLCREAADVLYVSVGHLLALGKDGLEAIDQVSLKNNKKKNKTHFLEKGKKGKKAKYLSFLPLKHWFLWNLF